MKSVTREVHKEELLPILDTGFERVYIVQALDAIDALRERESAPVFNSQRTHTGHPKTFDTENMHAV